MIIMLMCYLQQHVQQYVIIFPFIYPSTATRAVFRIFVWGGLGGVLDILTLSYH